MVIAFQSQRGRSDSVCAPHDYAGLHDAFSRVPDLHVGQGEVVGEAVSHSRGQQAELSGSRINFRLHCLVDVSGDPPGNLGKIP